MEYRYYEVRVKEDNESTEVEIFEHSGPRKDFLGGDFKNARMSHKNGWKLGGS